MIAERGLDTKVILDGRISKDNMVEFGPKGIADIFVAGSTCLDKNDLENSARQLIQFRKDILGEV
jgi:ribulose-phosphate 3-epimerase